MGVGSGRIGTEFKRNKCMHEGTTHGLQFELSDDVGTWLRSVSGYAHNDLMLESFLRKSSHREGLNVGILNLVLSFDSTKFSTSSKSQKLLHIM